MSVHSENSDIFHDTVIYPFNDVDDLLELPNVYSGEQRYLYTTHGAYYGTSNLNHVKTVY